MASEPFEVLTVEEYKAQIVDTDTDHVLIDVREEDEYADVHVPHAINLPLSELQARFGEVPKEGTVMLICRSGGRSAQAASFLATQGYDNLTNIDGGTMGWLQAGYEVE